MFVLEDPQVPLALMSTHSFPGFFPALPPSRCLAFFAFPPFKMGVVAKSFSVLPGFSSAKRRAEDFGVPCLAAFFNAGPGTYRGRAGNEDRA